MVYGPNFPDVFNSEYAGLHTSMISRVICMEVDNVLWAVGSCWDLGSHIIPVEPYPHCRILREDYFWWGINLRNYLVRSCRSELNCRYRV